MAEVPVDALVAAMQGDPDAADDAFTTDVVFVDETSGEVFDGIEEVREVWAEMAGRRGLAEVDVLDAQEGSATIAYVLRFRADAYQYAQRGTASVTLDADRISKWRSSWVEVEDDLSAWDGD